MKQFIIKGNTPSQKNRKIISVNRRTNRPFLRSANGVREWKTSAVYQLIQQRGASVNSFSGPVIVKVTIYYGDRRRHDLDNALSSIMDALVEAGIIEDDDYNHVRTIIIWFGGYDKTNPRAEITINE